MHNIYLQEHLMKRIYLCTKKTHFFKIIVEKKEQFFPDYVHMRENKKLNTLHLRGKQILDNKVYFCCFCDKSFVCVT
jgi:hypothetical protein